LVDNRFIRDTSHSRNRTSKLSDAERGRQCPGVAEPPDEAKPEHAPRGIEARSAAAYLDAALDCVIMADSSGRVVEFNPAAERTFGYRREEALGQTMAELIVPAGLRDSHSRAFARFVETGEGRLLGRRLELTGMRADGSEFPVELSLSRVQGEPLLICGALRDISERKEASDALRLLVEEQDALRRVATLVAREPKPSDVFSAVATEAAKILHSPLVSMVRYEDDATATVIASLDEANFPVDSNWPAEGPTIIASVLKTGRAARVDDYADIPGLIGEQVRKAGIHSAVGAPITVDRQTWGALIAVAPGTEALPEDTEVRLGRFTELVAVAIAKTQARDEARRLGGEQGALRRVATLVAGGATPTDVFAAVGKEVAELFGVPAISMVRFEPAGDGSTIQVGAWGPANPHPIGIWNPPHPGVIQLVWETGQPARIDAYSDIAGPIAKGLLSAGLRSAIGAPIVVDGNIWGGVAALSTSPEPLPEGAEARLGSFTELVGTAIANAQARDDLRLLADEQAALRRVATLVARGADPRAVFDAVCEETGRVIGASSVNLAHFTPDGYNVTVAGWSVRDTHVPTGTRLPLEGETINVVVRRTGAPARLDSYAKATGELAALIRRRGVQSEVGAPVIVEGEIWGALIAGWDMSERSPEGTEFRLASFAELIATAISNAAGRSELIASRARIVTTADETRRRIERDLHDGTQQQLISLGFDLQSVKSMLPEDLPGPQSELDRVRDRLLAVIADVREISRGLHPALLSQAGLGPALTALARRSPIPAELHLGIDHRLPDPIEIAAYYVVSEALANAAKHAKASGVDIAVESDDVLRVVVSDDGQGGARARDGSGLVGLIDRVEALGGRFVLNSPRGGGTTISIELPLPN
jgi:PAS domain S-box-containing protein